MGTFSDIKHMCNWRQKNVITGFSVWDLVSCKVNLQRNGGNLSVHFYHYILNLEPMLIQTENSTCRDKGHLKNYLLLIQKTYKELIESGQPFQLNFWASS